MESRRLNMVVFLLVIGIAAQSSYAQKTHTVGGSIGWTIPSNGAAAYTTWAASQTFAVGDILLFNFTTGGHTAAEVTKAAYDACTTTNPITTWATGPASVTLNTSGPHYYICTIPGHCSAGQKLSITVAAAAAPAPTPTPTKPPTPTPTPTPTVSPPTPTPTPASAPSPTGTTPSPSPSPASPTTSPPAPPPAGTTPSPASGPGSSGTPSAPPPGDSNTPPAPSSAAFVAAALPVTILSIAMALFY